MGEIMFDDDCFTTITSAGVPRVGGLIAAFVLVASLSIRHGRAEMPEVLKYTKKAFAIHFFLFGDCGIRTTFVQKSLPYLSIICHT